MPTLLTVRKLMLAAGGGGDAITAAALSQTTPGEAVGIATLAWDRLIVDPLPGPRSASDFTSLRSEDGYYRLTPQTRPIAPAGSTLPRLAAELPLPLILLDPAGGAIGIRRQLTAAMEHLNADVVDLVDVGGDILGRPGDVGLRSPLADGLTAAGTAGLPTNVWIAGAGLDGELAEALVLERVGHTAASVRLTSETWSAYRQILDWHPSEATALLAGASIGLRGTVEIRDAGLPVCLTDNSPNVYEPNYPALIAANPLVSALVDTTTFSEAEHITHGMFGWTELDAERTKAIRTARSKPTPADIDLVLSRWQTDASQRGVNYATFRRLAEVLQRTDIGELKKSLIERWPERFAWPLWHLPRNLPSRTL